MSAITISQDGGEIAVKIADGGDGCLRCHAQWLRDNALDEGTRSSQNGQKVIALLDQPEQPRIEQAELSGQELVVVIDGSDYRFPLTWLVAHRYDQVAADQAQGWLALERSPWQRDLLSAHGSDITVGYDELLTNDRCLLGWLSSFRRYGIGIVQGFAADDSEAIVKVAERFGYIRSTNYGKVFDVKTELNPTNLAFTGLGLEVHTDNPYRDPVPTIQLLACMANSAEGGDSIVADGFAAAKLLQENDPEGFQLLSEYPVDFCYAGSEDVDLRCQKPIIELAPDGELIGVRFNNRSSAPITRVPFAKMPQFYRALRQFATLLNSEKLQASFKLAAGELFMVDNRRVLHGRAEVLGAGNRWLRGCYADVDALESRQRVLTRQFADNS